MDIAELAERFVDADDAERERLLRDHPTEAQSRLGYALKDICLNAWASDPARATRAANALDFCARKTGDKEVTACAAWGAGIAALVAAKMEIAILHLGDAGSRFIALGLQQKAAETQVSKLIALATLGRYDEAVDCGLKALEVFEAHGDILCSGKIEHNIGNIYWRRDRYREAERFFCAARVRFEALKDDHQLATLDNCLAYIQSIKHNFRSAEELYDQALQRAENAGLVATQAGIESSIGNLALFQGRYDRALDYLERARRRYSEMGMPHETAISELEIADAYMELNLAPEAAELYERIVPIFGELSMRAEQAVALAHHGRAAIVLGEMEKAQRLLNDARVLYAAEGNTLGEAMVALTLAQMHHANGNFPATMLAAQQAEIPLAEAGVWRHSLMARWLRGEAANALGSITDARVILNSALADAVEQEQPQVAQRCHTSLGLISARSGDVTEAENSFRRSIDLIEELRAPLPAEEFRAAFFSDKLVPYDEMVRLCLADERTNRIAEAFDFVERARSRALADMTGGTLKLQLLPRNAFEKELLNQIEVLREELNWFYSQTNRPISRDDPAENATEMASLNTGIVERENKISELMRQLQHCNAQSSPIFDVTTLDLEGLRKDLGKETALVEYHSLDGEFLAFVVTNEGIQVVRHLGRETDVETELTKLRFQIDTLRYGAQRIRKHLSHLTSRALDHLKKLHDWLLAPLEKHFGDRRVVIIPHRLLHYIPFQALHDGDHYVIEKREVSYSPSAAVLRHCLHREHRPLDHAVLVGVPDHQAPRVRDEVKALEPLFESVTTLLSDAATLAAVNMNAPQANVLHLACHGQFRADNPRFSSLRLAGDWMTMRDASALDLSKCEIVSLSACETGVNAVAPGDELIGLARGFFTAGAPSILMSLWTVDDEATADLMLSFYEQLCSGASASKALRHAQIETMKRHSHPFFWSPFVLFGRW
jgi:CHAT domain-containing protein